MQNLQHIIYNCKQAQLLGIKKQEVGLNRGENIKLQMHLATCSICKKFLEQSSVIDDAIKRILQKDVETHTLSKEKKKQLQEQVNNELL